jgi:hypothetical protein
MFAPHDVMNPSILSRRRARPLSANPSPRKPTKIIAQVEGSGTVGGSKRLSTMNTLGAFAVKPLGSVNTSVPTGKSTLLKKSPLNDPGFPNPDTDSDKVKAMGGDALFS